MATRRTTQTLPSALKLDVTPEQIINTIDNSVGKKIVTAIFDAFVSNKLRYKATVQWKPKDSAEPEGYTVHFLIKGSKDAIIINTRHFNTIQIRINDWSTFDRLDEYSENIRNAILSSERCNSCQEKFCINNEDFIEQGNYFFIYHGKEYRRCKILSRHFILRNLTENDIDSLMDIINREIVFAKPKFAKLNP